MGRPKYDREKLLKVVLFSFMAFGYCSVRLIHKLWKTDIRFMWLPDDEAAPSHMTIRNFIHIPFTPTMDKESKRRGCTTATVYWPPVINFDKAFVETENPNAVPIGTKFGFDLFGDPYGTRTQSTGNSPLFV